MVEESDPVAVVCGRFPAWRGAIERWYETVPEVREMCDDYEEAIQALAYWTSLPGIVPRCDAAHPGMQVDPYSAQKVANDYLECLVELEREILQYLVSHS